jgi:hypothetical protein
MPLSWPRVRDYDRLDETLFFRQCLERSRSNLKGLATVTSTFKECLVTA